MPVLSTEQKEQIKQQLQRARDAKACKENQIAFKRARAGYFKDMAVAQRGEDDELGALLAENDAAILMNDATLLEMDFQEYIIMVDNLEAQFSALDSGLVLPVGAVQKGRR